tara:strand:+ start:2084 stop:2572 length:489 start_codon:yes stop_codon:yes gene_type:complete
MINNTILNLLLIGIMITIYSLGIPIPNYNIEWLNYILRSFFHADIQHLTANIIGFGQFSNSINLLPASTYITMLIWLIIASSLIHYLINTYLLSDTNSISIGFSGVLFGLLVIIQRSIQNNDTKTIIYTAILHVLPHLFLPNISFWGHVSGIIAGLLYFYYI